MQDETRLSRALPVRHQVFAVAGLAIAMGVAALLFVTLSTGSGLSETVPLPAHPTKFILTNQQLASLQIRSVTTRAFHTEIVTEGYVAPNGGVAAADASAGGHISHGLPVLTGQSSDVLQAESDLTTASAQFRAAKANEKRQHSLYNTDGAALKDWQQAKVDLATAAAARASARSRLRLLGKTDAEIASFEGGTGRAQASGGVFSVGDLSTVWLVADVREADAGLIHLGDTVEVRVPAFPTETFKAPVSYIASVIDPTTHRLVIGAAIRNKDSKLKPNMQAAVTIFAGQSSPALAVLQNAIVYEGDTAKVWIVGADGALNLRPVTIGRINGDFAEVTRGLSARARIVTSGALFLDQASSSD